MKRVLINFAHPAKGRSRINAALRAAVEGCSLCAPFDAASVGTMRVTRLMTWDWSATWRSSGRISISSRSDSGV
jgi:hypothetical protein